MTLHSLHTSPVFYENIANGTKTFEIHRDDRMFKTGDVLLFQEYDRDTGYTGRFVKMEFTYLTRWNQLEEHVVMAIKPLPEGHPYRYATDDEGKERRK